MFLVKSRAKITNQNWNLLTGSCLDLGILFVGCVYDGLCLHDLNV